MTFLSRNCQQKLKKTVFFKNHGKSRYVHLFPPLYEAKNNPFCPDTNSQRLKSSFDELFLIKIIHIFQKDNALELYPQLTSLHMLIYHPYRHW
jgi:hypothetical protein